jgi:arylformamidase
MSTLTKVGVVDLTMPFSSRTIPVPGHPHASFETLTELERDGIRNTLLTLSLHTGTHVDAPSHIIPDGRTIDEIEIDRFHRPGVRLDLTRLATFGEPIGLDMLVEAGFEPGAARDAILLFNTGWSDEAWEREELYGGNPFLDRAAAEAVAEARPSALGLDFAVDEAKPWPNHSILLGEEVLLIENLMGLRRLPGSGFMVSAFPLKIVGENGGPARVVAHV